jgi:hypothetical protein
MFRHFLLSIFFTFILIQSYCQSGVYNHPRGLITASELSEIRKKVQHHPYSDMLKQMEQTMTELQVTIKTNEHDVYQHMSLATIFAQLYVLKDDPEYASKAFNVSEEVMKTSEYLKNDISRGLTRATLVFRLAIVYDLIYHELSIAQRQLFLQTLYDGMLSVSSNMGYSANYALESNWMGVRYATVLFTALVWDETNMEQGRSRALPFIWDAQKRLADHIDANIYSQGWNVESLGYHGYNWSFIAPALIAIQNNYAHDAFLLPNYAPDALGSLRALAVSSVPIKTRRQNYGAKPDFSDDNTSTGMFLYACGQRLYPAEQQPAIKWMYDYFVEAGVSSGKRGENFFNIAYDAPSTTALNPESLNWHRFVDTTQGVVVLRNRFNDRNDVVFAFNTTSNRVKGHQGFDNLGIRLIGLDNIWIVGAGRTQEVAGQSTLFPGGDIGKMKGEQGATGNLIEHEFTDTGGFAIGEGSCMHVDNHVRQVKVDYHCDLDAKAVFRIDDTSKNGKIWRINTPEFNDVKVFEDGFLLAAPNGSMLRAYIVEGLEKPNISIQKVRYGGSTSRHNPGICFHGECHEFTTAVDISCNGDISVVLVLQQSGKMLPSLESVRAMMEFE